MAAGKSWRTCSRVPVEASHIWTVRSRPAETTMLSPMPPPSKHSTSSSWPERTISRYGPTAQSGATEAACLRRRLVMTDGHMTYAIMTVVKKHVVTTTVAKMTASGPSWCRYGRNCGIHMDNSVTQYGHVSIDSACRLARLMSDPPKTADPARDEDDESKRTSSADDAEDDERGQEEEDEAKGDELEGASTTDGGCAVGRRDRWITGGVKRMWLGGWICTNRFLFSGLTIAQKSSAALLNG